jgi:hypothetical protein
MTTEDLIEKIYALGLEEVVTGEREPSSDEEDTLLQLASAYFEDPEADLEELLPRLQEELDLDGSSDDEDDDYDDEDEEDEEEEDEDEDEDDDFDDEDDLDEEDEEEDE